MSDMNSEQKARSHDAPLLLNPNPCHLTSLVQRVDHLRRVCLKAVDDPCVQEYNLTNDRLHLCAPKCACHFWVPRYRPEVRIQQLRGNAKLC